MQHLQMQKLVLPKPATHQDMDQGKECSWIPIFWKSARLPQVVSSTLSAGAQSMAVASIACASGLHYSFLKLLMDHVSCIAVGINQLSALCW